MLKLFVSLVLFSSCVVFSQSKSSNNHIFNIESVYINSFGYTGYANDEQHSNFTVDWRVNKNNILMINGNYDTYSLGDISKFQLIYKKKITDKLSTFTGYEKSMQRDVFSGNTSENSNAVIGLGYDVQDNMSIQVINQTRIGNQNSSNLDIGSLLKLGTKLKF